MADTVYASAYDMPHYLYQTALIAQGLQKPYENMFVMAGPKVVSISTHSKNGVNITPAYLQSILKSKGVDIGNVSAIIHNHPQHQDWASKDDVDAMNQLRQLGFNGKYRIYAKGRFVDVGE